MLSKELAGLRAKIDERKKAEEELKESEEKFRSLVEESLVGVFILQNNQFKYVNPRFERIFGYNKMFFRSFGISDLQKELLSMKLTIF